MNQNLLALITGLSPLIFTVTAVASWFQSGKRPKQLKRLAMASASFSIGIAVISGYFVMSYGFLETSLLGIAGLGLSLRLDALSSLMLTMISLLGYIVIRFSLNYLDGEDRQGAFIGRLAATIASVQLLVLSGNLGLLFISWVLTSMSLHRLLIFYKERPGAIIAARKKFIVARLGDACLFAAISILYVQFGTGNLELIFQSIKNSNTAIAGMESVAILLVFTALFKSAQFPTHGWLIEVMETPTPVSALLHAGLLNAGPYLIVRMAYIMESSTYAPLILISVGGFTALFASVVFLTQTSIKTALGYSSIAHMGFSLMVCGLGVYPAAMLHLVAHSFYKAHSFLSSGSVIDSIRSAKVAGARRMGSPIRMAIGIFLGMIVYIGFAMLWGIDPVNEFSLIAIGAIIAMGLSRLFATAIDSTGGMNLLVRAFLASMIITMAFFSLESGTHYLLSSQLPELVGPSMGEMVLIVIILTAFALTVYLQIAAPILSNSPYSHRWAIHLRNGLYVNTLFDRTVRALYSHDTTKIPTIIENKDYSLQPDSLALQRYEL